MSRSRGAWVMQIEGTAMLWICRIEGADPNRTMNDTQMPGTRLIRRLNPWSGTAIRAVEPFQPICLP